MAGWIEVLSFFENAPVIECRHEQLFHWPGGRHQPLSVRPGNTRPTAGQYFRARRSDHLAPSRRSPEVFTAHQSRNRRNIRPGLQRDIARDVPSVVNPTRPHGDMQILALRIEGRSWQWHPILPAIQDANAKRAQRMRSQPVTVTGGPD